MKKIFDVYYAINPTFRLQTLKVRDLKQTHRFVRSVETSHLDNVYSLMQGEVWSPRGEARSLIESLELDHTSMSVGDVACDVEVDEYWQVDSIGWKQISKV
jgi:hypothetical protein